jgi:hypothetical protein
VAIQKLIFYSEDNKVLDVLRSAEEDLSGTCKIEKTELIQSEGKGRTVQGYPNIQFVAQY